VPGQRLTLESTRTRRRCNLNLGAPMRAMLSTVNSTVKMSC